MLLAIDLGNTETRAGVWDGSAWQGIWRRSTNIASPVDDIAGWLESKIGEQSPQAVLNGAILASVVPRATDTMILAMNRVTGRAPVQLEVDPVLNLDIRYNPRSSLGADRLANALAAKASLKLPALVVDIGTATTFEAIDRTGAFLGGAIMPGPALSASVLAQGTAALPEATLEMPPNPIGDSTLHAIQSGIMLGHAGAVQGLAERISKELGKETTVIATGGLGERFLPLCPILTAYHPTLTLDGLVVAFGLYTGIPS